MERVAVSLGVTAGRLDRGLHDFQVLSITERFTFLLAFTGAQEPEISMFSLEEKFGEEGKTLFWQAPRHKVARVLGQKLTELLLRDDVALPAGEGCRRCFHVAGLDPGQNGVCAHRKKLSDMVKAVLTSPLPDRTIVPLHEAVDGLLGRFEFLNCCVVALLHHEVNGLLVPLSPLPGSWSFDPVFVQVPPARMIAESCEGLKLLL